MPTAASIAKFKAEGLCLKCGKNFPIPNKNLCEKCNEDMHERSRRKYQKDKSNGDYHCGYKAIIKGNCVSCWFDQIARNATGSRLNGVYLAEKFEEQKHLCYYTNKIMIPGVNASIDHKIPRKRGGSDDLINLVWCDFNVNMQKRDLTEKEFIEQCKLVYLNSTKQQKETE